ncbi:MAG: hypothetical protein ABI448_01050 [Bacteroidia bacterium]
MKSYHIISHNVNQYQTASTKFEEDFYNSKLTYSIRHLSLIGNIKEENINEAIKKSLQICRLAGINSQYHFKKIYVFDANSQTLYTDWLMSKNGLNLMMMQLNNINEKKAQWLWELSNL